MTNLEIIKKLQAGTFVDEDGDEYTLEFEPALPEEELSKLAARFPLGKIPPEIREILQETKGWGGYGIEQCYFDSIDEFGMEELVPLSITLGTDGFGNFWIMEITADGRCGKIFYASHDPAVLVLFCDTLNEYLQILLEFYNNPGENYLNEVHDQVTHEIWKSAPNMHEVAAFRQNNPALASLIDDLDGNWMVVDLRNAKKKDGFAWGRFGAKGGVKRLNEELLWALEKKKKGFFSRLFG